MATKKTSATSAIKKTASAKPTGKSKLGSSAKPATKAIAKVTSKAPAKKPAKAARKTAPAKAKSKGEKRSGAVMHWEIQSKQPEVLHDFYSEVFGWKIDTNNSMKYGLVSSKGATGGIDGGIGGSPDASARVLVYASVPSITSTLELIEDLGGKTIMPRTDIGMVVMAIYVDPEGNTMGLIEDT